MIRFRQFEAVYDGPVVQLDEGAVAGLKNFLSRLFGGKVKKLDDIVRSIRDADSEYWKEWSDNSFRYNEANVIYHQAMSPVERAKQEETMKRIKKLLDTLASGREEYRKALEKQAAILVNGNERLKDYYTMELAKAESDIAQNTYDDVKKISDEDLIDRAYKRLDSRLAEVKRHDERFKQKYGDSYQKNLFGLSDSDFGHGKDFTGHGINLETYLYMDDRMFAGAVKKLPEADLRDLEERMREELEAEKSKLTKMKEESELRIEAAKDDKAMIKREKDQAHFAETEVDHRIKKISRKIGVLAGVAETSVHRSV